MKVANLAGRAVLIGGDSSEPTAVDVHTASAGRFGSDPSAIFTHWGAFLAWADGLPPEARVGRPFDPARLGPPSPSPGQVVAIGLNYAEHAAEVDIAGAAGASPAARPPMSVFTKFPSCLTGPRRDVELPADADVDWEVEVVAVISHEATRVDAAEAWHYVAGLCIGQDLSDRRLQLAATPPQFSLGKSHRGFGPTGPWLVTPDELDWESGLELGAAVNGERVQTGTTLDMIRDVPDLVAELTAVLTLRPGDLIFTGTPPGVGMGRTPQRWLVDGDRLESWVGGLGGMAQSFVNGSRDR